MGWRADSMPEGAYEGGLVQKAMGFPHPCHWIHDKDGVPPFAAQESEMQLLPKAAE